jgi:hypothetical protein
MKALDKNTRYKTEVTELYLAEYRAITDDLTTVKAAADIQTRKAVIREHIFTEVFVSYLGDCENCEIKEVK